MPDSSIAIYFLHNYARGLFPALTKLARSEKVVPKDSLFYQVQLEGLDPKQSKLLLECLLLECLFPIPYRKRPYHYNTILILNSRLNADD
ncbi:hypothetical protein BI308_24975 [Roseofilum reptotaenium AO1-A]|uniref:Uncharacterized protein n=1 Tax=Roseofilum reptotaenium AO1-A TaxID=1925591 RepID=A0A1L9QJQ1_9CYAN|nr:hypothetical protein BI308_24975 [Roseofilum reptotaenium AO1-A]